MEHAQPKFTEADLAALGQLDRRDRRRDFERGEQRLWVLEARPIERMDGDVGACVSRDRGLEQAALGVDSENPTGALGVYEALGFRRFQTGISFRKSL